MKEIAVKHKIKSVALPAGLQTESHDCSYWKLNSNQRIGKKALGSVPKCIQPGQCFPEPLHAPSATPIPAEDLTRSQLLEWLRMELCSCLHPVMCPVEDAGAFLSDASTCPGCACLPPSCPAMLPCSAAQEVSEP